MIVFVWGGDAPAGSSLRRERMLRTFEEVLQLQLPLRASSTEVNGRMIQRARRNDSVST
jgi:hypothetical protein